MGFSASTDPSVMITGALTGIGRATAFAFAREGARLTVSGRREEAGNAMVEELLALGCQAQFIRTDVRVEAEVAALIDGAVARFGSLDVAINNAGHEGENGPISAQSLESYTATFDTNVLGVLLCLKHEFRVMAPRAHGSIVNLSSIAGLVGMSGASVYVASKHAVEGLTKTAALEGAAVGIRVNAVAPGPVATDMLDRFTGRDADAKAGFLGSIPTTRAASPEEIAQTILFLASDRAPYLTGQSVAVDGGYSAR